MCNPTVPGGQFDPMRLKHPDMQGDLINLEALDIKQTELILMPTRELNKFLKVTQQII